MASFNTHLAVAKLYAKRNKIKDLASFYRGSIDPDLTDKKDTTHYGVTPNSFENAWVRVANKVDLAKFLKHNKLDNDLNLGRFLHLVTDMKFFNEFFGKKYMINAGHDQFSADLFFSYLLANPHLARKYKLPENSVDEIMGQKIQQKHFKYASDRIDQVKKDLNYSPKCIIDMDSLDRFIEEVASLELQSIALRARRS